MWEGDIKLVVRERSRGSGGMQYQSLVNTALKLLT
jgi:hypothetical protein